MPYGIGMPYSSTGTGSSAHTGNIPVVRKYNIHLTMRTVDLLEYMYVCVTIGSVGFDHRSIIVVVIVGVVVFCCCCHLLSECFDVGSHGHVVQFLRWNDVSSCDGMT